MWDLTPRPFPQCRWNFYQNKKTSFIKLVCKYCLQNAGNSPVSGEFPTQRPVTRSYDVFFDLHPNKRLSKQWWGWWFETLLSPLWRHRNATKQSTNKPGAYCIDHSLNHAIEFTMFCFRNNYRTYNMELNRYNSTGGHRWLPAQKHL